MLFYISFPPLFNGRAMLTLFPSTLQTGTTLMIALPLGTVLCFFDLLGARAFSRGEVSSYLH